MAKVKFSLTASPTFKSKVLIPIPGQAAGEIEFTFKGKTRAEFKEFLDELSDKEDVDTILEITSGWDLIDAFDRDNIDLLTQHHMGAARAIIEKYLSELTAARLGN